SLVLELTLLDRTRDGAADRHPLQDLEVRQLVGTDHPVAMAGQVVSVTVTPQDLYGSLHELGVQPCGLPEARAMGLQIDGVQDAADAAWADRVDDAVGHGLARQVGAGPVRDVQPPSHRLQAGQWNDLSPLEGGKSGPLVRSALAGRWRAGPAVLSGHSAGKCARPSPGHIGGAGRWSERARRQRWPRRCGRVGLDTRGGSHYGQWTARRLGRDAEGPRSEVSGRA